MKRIKIGLVLVLAALLACQAAAYSHRPKNNGNAPIISSDVDEIQIPCQYSEEDLLQGLSAYDVEDGYITENILIGGFSDFSERGVSSLEYAVYDKDGNMALFNRKVVFSDYTPPRIIISDPLVFKPAANPYDIPSLHLEAKDKLDGDISKHILVTSEDMDFSEPGKYTLSAHARNSFGDEVEVDLPVHILDSGINGIKIELKKPLIHVGKGATVNPGEYITAIRNEYTNEIIPEGEYELTIHSAVDTAKDGVYEIQFSAASSDKVQRGETWLTVVVGD